MGSGHGPGLGVSISCVRAENPQQKQISVIVMTLRGVRMFSARDREYGVMTGGL